MKDNEVNNEIVEEETKSEESKKKKFSMEEMYSNRNHNCCVYSYIKLITNK